ncbi:multiple epidermal growth factor-like domains protein 10, partial [Saccostrea cucullata]|uniref:multiple epidermal growth factor-like domains protein 10 n=1 Tax=Saccostrea cuccullata TaxID=36930 RepID=UPI002ED545DF
MDMMTRSECPKNSIRNNKTQLCECKNGYTGATCNEVCDNGTYGFVCGTKCECPLEECHFERGCLNKTVFGLLVIYCFCFEKRKRNGIGKCPAGAQNLNLQER